LTKHITAGDFAHMNIDANSNPLQVFESWMKEAHNHSGIQYPTAMALATLGKDGELHNRVVLCKSWGEEGFTFFTNYDSRKGQDLAANARTSAVFYWDPLFRQVKISGTVEKTTRKASEDYWRTRPRESQVSQYVSRQSEEVVSREALEKAWTEADVAFKDREVPCPENWGGYLIQPTRIEFWIGRPGRLHDRYEFEKRGGNWTFRQLYP
jgi:pyridoxamine 5'-phosphate oxidase